MPEFEAFLATRLPRPEADGRFADELLQRVLAADPDWVPTHLAPQRRRIYYVGGALAGAALALGAAFGWKRVRFFRDFVSQRAA